MISDEPHSGPDPLDKLVERLHDGLCHHAFFRRVEHIIAHIGAGGPVRLPGAGDEGRRIRGAVTDYVHALGSWLAGRTCDHTIAIWPPGEQVARSVFGVLGISTPRKRWLVARLWKRLQDANARLGRGPLDDEPEGFEVPAEALAPGCASAVRGCGRNPKVEQRPTRVPQCAQLRWRVDGTRTAADDLLCVSCRAPV